MTEQDPLNAFFNAGEVSAFDPDFRARTMDRIAQRRFGVELAVRLVAGVLLVFGLMMLGPGLATLASEVLPPELTPVLLALALAAGIAYSGHYLLTHSIRVPRLRFF